MVENLTTRAILKDKLSTVASDFIAKVDSTVRTAGEVTSFAKDKPTEETPRNYKVTHRGGALVRAGYETTTSQVHQLAAGEIVTVVEIIGRRARIVTPVDGWLSTETKDGVQIMRQCHMQRKSQQNQAFENMFEQKFQRMKDQRERKSGRPPSNDPRAEHSPSYSSRSPSPRDRYNDSRRDRYDEDRRGSYDDGRRDRKDDRRRDRSDEGRRSPPRDDSMSDEERERGRGSKVITKGSSSKSQSTADRQQPARAEASSDDKTFVPRLLPPGSAGGPVAAAPAQAQGPPRTAAGSASSSGGVDLFGMEPGAANIGGGNTLDLLSIGNDSVGGLPQAGGFDPFADQPVAPVSPAHGVSNPGGQSAGSWDAFGPSGPPSGSGVSAPSGQQQGFANFGQPGGHAQMQIGAAGMQQGVQGQMMQQGMQGQMGMQAGAGMSMGGSYPSARPMGGGMQGMGMQGMGMQGMGMQGMGMQAGQMGMPGQSQGMMGQGMMNPGMMGPGMMGRGMAQGQMNPGFAGGGMMSQGVMNQGVMNPSMMGQNIAQGQMQPGFGAGGVRPQGGVPQAAAQQSGPAASAQHQQQPNADDMMNKVMGGIDMMSFDNRAQTTRSNPSGHSMNQMHFMK